MAGGTIIGLDIGSSMMKVAEMRKAGSGVEVTALGVAPTPQDAFDNSMLIDPQLLATAVKKLLTDSGVTAKQVISSVSGQTGIVVRVIDVPQMDAKQLEETMRWEVERQVPFASSEVIMDYQPIDRPEGYPEGQNMDILLAVAQQEMIDRHVEMIQSAGLKPVAIDVEPLACSRTLLDMAGDQPEGHSALIVNIGASVSDIGIFRDKLPVFLRSVPLAGDNFTRAIGEAFMVDMETAENYKKQYAEVVFGQAAAPAPAFSSGFMDFTAPAAPVAPGA